MTRCRLLAQSVVRIISAIWSLSGGKRTNRKTVAISHNRLLWPNNIYRWVKYRVDHPPCGITRCRELIAVAVVGINRDPVVRDRFVDPALEVAIAYVEKIIALKGAARRYPVADENAEDLAADFIIGGSVTHQVPVFQRRSILASRDAP